MGLYVHLHLCFSCNNNDAIAALAKKHLDERGYNGFEPGERDARIFLKDASRRSGNNPGPKGGLFLWGITGNYSEADKFIEQLMPFWEEMFENEIEIFSFENIVVFEEVEQRGYATAYEISWDDKVIVRKHKCPFMWGQR